MGDPESDRDPDSSGEPSDSDGAPGDLVDRVDLGRLGRWQRHVITTPWFQVGDDLPELVVGAVEEHRTGDGEQFVVVTEKVVSLAAGLAVDAADISVGRLATFLAARIRPQGDSLALAVPEKMQWVIDDIGRPRVLLASLVSAVTRLVGIRGGFYAVAGNSARSVDGVRGVYPNTLIPPLDRRASTAWCARLSHAARLPLAIIDYNDRGGTVRAVSPGLDMALVKAAVADNPLGSRDESTPVAVITRC